MVQIGWCNLKRDRMRLAVAVLGVVFSVVLVTVETGLLQGLMRNASLLIDNSSADIWISAVDVPTFDFATPFNSGKRYRVEAVEGVERVEEFYCSYSAWKLPGGGDANIEIVGIDIRGDLAARVELVEGSIEDLAESGTIVIDDGDREKLGGIKIGDVVEIFKHRAKVVGFTRGMRSFTTTPYVFTALRNIPQYSLMDESGMTMYLLARTAPGADVDAVRARIASSIPDIEAHTRESFSWRTRRYWLIETGMGVGFLGAALLGLLVGGVIVSQTLFAMTVEKLPEFGVLKALGGNMIEISHIVLQQGLICGTAGFAIGILLSLALSRAANSAGTMVQITFTQVACVGLMTTCLCAGASLLSVLRLRRLDPASVFRT